MMSPGKKTFSLIRSYPSLVNCTTIDWFMQWPEEALKKVGYRFMSEMDSVGEDIEAIVDKRFVNAHITANELAD